MKTIDCFKVFVLAGILLAGMVGCHRHQTEQSKHDGHWVGFDVTQPNARCEVTIKGTQLDYRGAQADDFCRGTFVLNESVKPTQMDLTVAESSNKDIVGKTMLIIQEVNGDEMKVAAAGPGTPVRPVDFSPSKQVRVFSFKRE